MQSLVLIEIVIISRPADFVDGRRWKAVIVDLTRQRQVHSNIGRVVERVDTITLRSLLGDSDESFVGDDRAPGVADAALVVTLERLDVVTHHFNHVVRPSKNYVISQPLPPATRYIVD